MTEKGDVYKLEFEERAGYLFTRVSAETIKRDSAIAYLTEIAGKCKEVKAKRLMLVRNIPMMLPDADLFFTTNDFLKMIGETRVAYVNPHDAISEEMDFAILIGVNRGGDYSLFNSEKEAERWLLN